MRLLKTALALLAWWAICWAGGQAYFERQADTAYRKESEAADRFVVTTAQGFERIVAVRVGMPKLIARDPELVRALVKVGSVAAGASLPFDARKRRWTEDPTLAALSRRFQADASDLGLSAVGMVDAAGNTIAASNAGTDRSYVGVNYGDRDYFADLRSGKAGYRMTVGKQHGVSGIAFYAPIMEDGRFVGAVMSRIDIAPFSNWLASQDVFLTDRNGVVMLSSDPTREMRAFADAPVRRMDTAAVQAAYRSTEFAVLEMGPWGDVRFPDLRRVADRGVPVLWRSRSIASGSEPVVNVLWPMHELVEVQRDHMHTVLAMGLLGSVSILFFQLAIARNRERQVRLASEVTSIREAERRMAQFVANLPGFVYTFHSTREGRGCFPFASPGIEKLYGLQPQDVRDDIAPLHQLVHPDDQARILAAVVESARTLEPVHAEFRIRRPGVPQTWAEFRSTPVRQSDGSTLWYGIMLDISERKRMEDALRDSRNFLYRTMDTIADPIFVKDRQHRWIYLNDAFCQFIGHEREALIGKSDFDFFPEQEARVFWAGDEKVFESGQEFTSEEAFTNCHGEKRHIITRKTRFTDANGEAILVGLISDISKRRQYEMAREAALTEAQRLVKLRSDFLAHMSHELRTPLNGILGHAQILQRDTSLPERRSAALGVIRKSGEHLLSMVDDLLDVARIDADRLALFPGDIALGSFLHTVGEIVGVMARETGLAFACELAADLPEVIRGDEKRLRQVLLNLLANAVKFTERGRVVLRVSRLEVSRLAFAVEDSGIGIAATDLEAIFQPFEQARGGVQRQLGGTGLGLAISRQLVRLMGGDIVVRSQVGVGSEFRFVLDLPEVQLGKHPVLASAPAAQKGAGISIALLASLRPPPMEELQALHRLALRGNMRDISTFAEHIAGLDPRCHPFAAHVRRLAGSYQSKAILTFVEHYLYGNTT